MKKETLGSLWEKYVEMVIPGARDDQIEGTQLGYYAGAKAAFEMIVSSAKSNDKSAFEAINTELDVFYSEVIVKMATEKMMQEG